MELFYKCASLHFHLICIHFAHQETPDGLSLKGGTLCSGPVLRKATTIGNKKCIHVYNLRGFYACTLPIFGNRILRILSQQNIVI